MAIVLDEKRAKARPEAVAADRRSLPSVALDALPALVSFVDRDLRYVFNNAAYGDWFGGAADGVKGKHVRDVLGEAAFEALRPYAERALKGERVSWEMRVPYVSGGRDVKVEYIPHRLESGEVAGFIALVIDRSEAVATEQALARSDEGLKLALDGAGAGAWDHDLLTKNFVWSERHCALFGVPKDTKPTFELWLDRLHADDRDAALAEFARAKVAKTPFRAVTASAKPTVARSAGSRTPGASFSTPPARRFAAPASCLTSPSASGPTKRCAKARNDSASSPTPRRRLSG